MKKILYLFIACLLIMASCRKDINQTLVEVDEDPPIVLIESSIRGKVVDENGTAIAFAQVSVGNENLQADANGCFHFKNVEVKKSGTIVKANASGYFGGSSPFQFYGRRKLLYRNQNDGKRNAPYDRKYYRRRNYQQWGYENKYPS